MLQEGVGYDGHQCVDDEDLARIAPRCTIV